MQRTFHSLKHGANFDPGRKHPRQCLLVRFFHHDPCFLPPGSTGLPIQKRASCQLIFKFCAKLRRQLVCPSLHREKLVPCPKCKSHTDCFEFVLCLLTSLGNGLGPICPPREIRALNAAACYITPFLHGLPMSDMLTPMMQKSCHSTKHEYVIACFHFCLILPNRLDCRINELSALRCRCMTLFSLAIRF